MDANRYPVNSSEVQKCTEDADTTDADTTDAAITGAEGTIEG